MPEQEVIVIVEVQAVHNAVALDAYRTQVRGQMTAFGGRLLARGGSLFEGTPPLEHGLLLQHWPSEEAFRAWQSSDAYAPLLRIRNEAARVRISIVPMVL